MSTYWVYQCVGEIYASPRTGVWARFEGAHLSSGRFAFRGLETGVCYFVNFKQFKLIHQWNVDNSDTLAPYRPLVSSSV